MNDDIYTQAIQFLSHVLNDKDLRKSTKETIAAVLVGEIVPASSLPQWSHGVKDWWVGRVMYELNIIHTRKKKKLKERNTNYEELVRIIKTYLANVF